VAACFLLIFAALGPEKWIPRSSFGWRVDHFFGYFALALMAGSALMAVAMLLEALQAFTADRHADVYAAMISAGGAMAAILPADFLIQAPRRSTGRALVRLARRRLLMVLHRGVAPQSPALGGLVGQQAPILTAISRASSR
jgi:VanZ family protein